MSKRFSSRLNSDADTCQGGVKPRAIWNRSISFIIGIKLSLSLLANQGFTHTKQRGAKKIINPSIRVRIKKILGKYSMDEGEIIYQLIKSRDKSKVMIDVGAHYGESLERYARDGWQIRAFEPDPTNRKHLIQLCGKFQNVKIDSRAVTDKSKNPTPEGPALV
jgi:hypothetical protein